MGHQITATDNVFSVREQTWHGLAKVLPDYPTRVEAQKLTMDWEPVSEPIFRRVPRIVTLADGTQDVVDEFEPVEDSVLNARSDNGQSLGVVSKTFTTVSNDELWSVAEAIQGEAGDVRFETAGSLDGGRKVWILVRLDEPLTVPGDPNGAHIAYYALQNSHDASGAFRGQATSVRIVCANTSQMADWDASQRGTEFAFRHSTNIQDRIAEARQALAGWREGVFAFQELTRELIALPVSAQNVERFIKVFIPMPPAGAASQRVEGHVEEAWSQLRTILAGPTCEGINRTSYGLVQAAIEYNNHVRAARSESTRFRRAYLTRDRVTTDAVRLARSLATV